MNNVANFIRKMEKKDFPFTPTPEFFKSIGVKKMRLRRILNDEVSPTLKEIEALASYFEVPVTEIIQQ